jgi:hypothetical protein
MALLMSAQQEGAPTFYRVPDEELSKYRVEGKQAQMGQELEGGKKASREEAHATITAGAQSGAEVSGYNDICIYDPGPWSAYYYWWYC